MRLARFLALLLAAASAVGLSCTGLNAADPMQDPSSTGASNFAPGTVGNQCTPDADGCQWQASECESDPVCAHWYACVLSRPVDANLQSAIASCQSSGLSTTQKKLLECLYASPSCKAVVPQQGAAGAAGGAATATPGADGGTGDLNGNGGNGGGAKTYDPECANQPLGAVAGTDCYNCIVNTCCGQYVNTDQINTCYAIKHTTGCWQGMEHEWQLENCLNNAQQPDAGVEFSSDAHAALVGLQVMACFLDTCSSVCLPPDARCCMQCQDANCAEPLANFLSSAEAQDYQWCRTHCEYGNEGQPVAGAADCAATCQASYPDGFAIVSALMGCKYDQCPVCNDLP